MSLQSIWSRLIRNESIWYGSTWIKSKCIHIESPTVCDINRYHIDRYDIDSFESI